MNRKLIACVLILSLTTALSGCLAIPEERRGAATGAGIGAATGAVAGAVLGKDTKSAVLGGLAGALLGGVVGHYAYDMQRSRDQTAQTYNYSETQGPVLSIENTSVVPQTAYAGDTVELKATYAVLNPSFNTNTAITEIREITHNGMLVGKPEVRVTRADGTYMTTVPLHLSASSSKGVYTVRTTVQSDTVKDTRETRFTVL